MPEPKKTKQSETVLLLRQIADNTERTAGYVKQFLNLAFVLIIIAAAIAFFVIMRS